MIDRVGIKQTARDLFKRSYWPCVAAYLLFGMISSLLCDGCMYFQFGPWAFESMYMLPWAGIISFLVMPVLYVGVSYFFIRIARGDDVLKKGFYISRIDGDIATYDIRMAIPNSGAYLTNPAIHTFEHLFATYVRNSALTDSIVYVGPMGCRTGFYFLTRGITHQQALDLFRDTLEFISTFDAPIPGAQSSRECGNWLEHDLPAARDLAIDMKRVLKDWTVDKMQYAE